MNSKKPSNKLNKSGRKSGADKKAGTSGSLDSTSYILIAFIIFLVFGGVYLVTRSPGGNTGAITDTTTSLSVSVAGLATGQPAVPALAQAGKPLYEKYCVSCHGVSGVGENPKDMYAIDKAGNVIAPPLDNTAHAWHHPDEALLDTILNGSPQNPRMVAWKSTLSQEDAVAVINYIKSLWGPKQLACQGDAHMSPDCQALSNTR